MIGGDPGIGKSTLLLQVASSVARRDGKVLYVTGEESLAQLKLRAVRLGAVEERLVAVSEADTEIISGIIEEEKPLLVIVDSIQTMYVQEIASPPGSVAQVREAAGRFLQLAKGGDTAILLVGHMTKGGNLAGPKVLEHAVDFVLYFEGDVHTSFRIIRSVKNRFGSTNEVGIFVMSGQGLIPVANPSEFLLSQRPVESPGSVVVPYMEGTRPLLVEVQALVTPTPYGATPETDHGSRLPKVFHGAGCSRKKAGLSPADARCVSQCCGRAEAAGTRLRSGHGGGGGQQHSQRKCPSPLRGAGGGWAGGGNQGSKEWNSALRSCTLGFSNGASFQNSGQGNEPLRVHGVGTIH